MAAAPTPQGMLSGGGMPDMNSLSGFGGGSTPILGGLSDMVQGGGGIAMGFINAATEKAKAKIVSQRAEFNAQMAEMNAANILKQSDEDAIDLMKNVNINVIAKQKTSYAAQGVKVNTGVAKQVSDEARYKAQQSVVAMRGNAQDRAFGLKVQANEERWGAALNKISSDASARNSMINGMVSGVSQIGKGMESIAKDLFAPAPGG